MIRFISVLINLLMCLNVSLTRTGDFDKKISYFILIHVYILHFKNCGQGCGSQSHHFQSLPSPLGFHSASDHVRHLASA